MDFADERYVRVYTRDTTTWKLLDWEARALLAMLLRKVDRAGVLDVGGEGLAGVAAHVEMPLPVVERAMPQLLARGVVVDAPSAYVLPRYIEAQEARQSDRQRKRDERERRRALVTMRDTAPEVDVTDRDRWSRKASQIVTDGHASTGDVTSGHSSLAVLDPLSLGSESPPSGLPASGAQDRAEHDQPPQPEAPPAGMELELPGGWRPAPEPELDLEAAAAGVDLEVELRALHDRCRARGTTSSDWQADWRTWVRRAIEWARRKPAQPSRPAKLDRPVREVAAIREREAREREERARRDEAALRERDEVEQQATAALDALRRGALA